MAEDGARKFHDMGLDDRLLKAVARLGWVAPTLIQEKTIPLVLEGKDVLVKARTGSGKTAAFALPIIQKILSLKQRGEGSGVLSLVLAPSKELSRQIYSQFERLLLKCSQEVRVIDISPQVEVGVQGGLLASLPEIVVATPGRAVLHLSQGSLSLARLQLLVLDEADLLFSFGHQQDIKALLKELPRVYQAVLASATLSEDVTALKGLLLHNAVSLKLQEPGVAPAAQLTHFRYLGEEKEKALFLYAAFKLSLVQGRTIVFVNSVNKCYKLKLFLEQFEISTCILNSELPAVSRIHALAQFNDGKYNIVITSDETGAIGQNEKKTKSRGFPKDKESGVSRGIDFRDVSNVINYDFPQSVTSYIHRVGRTARGSAKGTAISLVNIKEKPMMEEVNSFLSEGLSLREPNIFKEFQFNISEVEGLQYRVREAWKVVTKMAVKETRLAEIRHEIFNSKKLKHYFKDNPKDLETLRHDKASHVIKLPSHVANVPEYLVPVSLRGVPGLVPKRRKPNPRPTGLLHTKNRARMENPLSNYDILEQQEQNMEEQERQEKPEHHKRRYFGKRKFKY